MARPSAQHQALGPARGFLQGAQLFLTAAGRRGGRWGCLPVLRVEDSHVSLTVLFGSGHCHGNADKGFSEAEERDLKRGTDVCDAILGIVTAFAPQLERIRFPP